MPTIMLNVSDSIADKLFWRGFRRNLFTIRTISYYPRHSREGGNPARLPPSREWQKFVILMRFKLKNNLFY